MPKGRLEYLRRLLPYLQNQSEDCLYLNIYGPVQGMYRISPIFYIWIFLKNEIKHSCTFVFGLVSVWSDQTQTPKTATQIQMIMVLGAEF